MRSLATIDPLQKELCIKIPRKQYVKKLEGEFDEMIDQHLRTIRGISHDISMDKL